MNQNGPCKFCGKQAKLLKKSHVIPEFMYQEMYFNNQMQLYEFANPDKERAIQTGFFDKYYYCKDCENNLWGGLERYVAGLFNGNFIGNVPVIQKFRDSIGLDNVLLQNVDYAKFKLFVLSILWRADQSSHKFFKQVDIPEYRNQIKDMVLRNDPGPESLFKVSMFALLNKQGERVKIVNQPSAKRDQHLYIAIFFINGYVITVDLHPQNTFLFSQTFYLKATGELQVPLLKGELTFTFLTAFGIPANVAMFYAYV